MLLRYFLTWLLRHIETLYYPVNNATLFQLVGDRSNVGDRVPLYFTYSLVGFTISDTYDYTFVYFIANN